MENETTTNVNVDIDAIIGETDNEFLVQIREDWDALVRMFQYLIEFFTSLFGM